MVSEVPVPLNFGRHLLKLSRFNDFVLTASGGVELKGNSMILSFNSPVIMDLVSQQGCMAVDFEEFREDTVRTVLFSCYTGTATVTRENFREINKIAIALKIEWLRECCLEYFREMCKGVAEEHLPALFLEAEYVVREANDRSLAEALGNSLSKAAKSALVKNFAPEMRNSTVSYATTCLTISLFDSFAVLLESLRESKKATGKLEITGVDRKILTFDNLVAYRGVYQAGFDELVNLIEDSGDERILMTLWRVCRNKNIPLPLENLEMKSPVLNSFLDGTELLKCGSQKSLIETLLADDRVTNYETFIDAVAFWEFYSPVVFGNFPSPTNIGRIYIKEDFWIWNDEHFTKVDQKILDLLIKAKDKLGRPHFTAIFSKEVQKLSFTCSRTFKEVDGVSSRRLYPYEVEANSIRTSFSIEKRYNFLMSTNKEKACKLGTGACWIGAQFTPDPNKPFTVTIIKNQTAAKKLSPSGHYHFDDLYRVHFYWKPSFRDEPSGKFHDKSILIPLGWWHGDWKLFYEIFGYYNTQVRKGNKPIEYVDHEDFGVVDLVMYYSSSNCNTIYLLTQTTTGTPNCRRLSICLPR
eukprot:sb/3463349/